jgi:hypothetical protein
LSHAVGQAPFHTPLFVEPFGFPILGANVREGSPSILLHLAFDEIAADLASIRRERHLVRIGRLEDILDINRCEVAGGK